MLINLKKINRIFVSLVQFPGKILQTSNHRHRGVVLAWIAIMSIVLILIVGLSLDAAKLYLAAHQLQNAADAAALAGAQLVTTDNPNTSYQDTRDKTYDIARANYYTDNNMVKLDKNLSNDANGDIVIGLYYPQRTNPTRRFEANDTNFANAVKAAPKCMEGQANPPVSLIFGPIAKVPTANIKRDAIAMSIGGKGAGLIVLDPCAEPGLLLAGNVNLKVNNGTIQVNSEGDSKTDPAVTEDGSGNNIIAEEMDICGTGYKGPIPDEPPIVFKAPYMPDPLRNLVPPPTSSWGPDLSPINPNNNKRESISGGEWGPGYYSKGIDCSGSGTTTLNPGIYILDGAGLQVTSTSHLFTARGVMFYIIGTGSVNITGGPNLIITELKDGSIYDGMAIFQDRDNLNEAKITGGSEMQLVGTIYFPKNHLNLSGTSTSLGIQVIAWTLKVGGGGSNTDLIINYDGRNFTPSYISFLVE